jgi:hypothetical protein
MPLWSDLQLRPEVHLLEELNPRPFVNREAREEAKSQNTFAASRTSRFRPALRPSQRRRAVLNREGAKERRFR